MAHHQNQHNQQRQKFNPKQSQKHSQVLQAGRIAYRMLIPVNGNPHNGNLVYRDLWDKGWRLERRKDESARFPRKPAETVNTDRPKGRYPSRLQAQGVEPEATVITDGLVSKFNNRHQTRA